MILLHTHTQTSSACAPGVFCIRSLLWIIPILIIHPLSAHAVYSSIWDTGMYSVQRAAPRHRHKPFVRLMPLVFAVSASPQNKIKKQTQCQLLLLPSSLFRSTSRFSFTSFPTPSPQAQETHSPVNRSSPWVCRWTHEQICFRLETNRDFATNSHGQHYNPHAHPLLSIRNIRIYNSTLVGNCGGCPFGRVLHREQVPARQGSQPGPRSRAGSQEVKKRTSLIHLECWN